MGYQPIETNGVVTAVSGFQIILREGKNLGVGTDVHPRTAVGVTRDGRHLLVAVIDGRQPFYSVGATQIETAEMLKQLGAWNAINLDGGGSTSLAIEGADGKARLLNSPVHQGVPGRQRPCASHLGIFARRLEGKR